MDFKYRDILTNDCQLGPYPLEKLPRVDKPTVVYTGHTERRNERYMALIRCILGDYGEAVAKKAQGFTVKEPLGAAFLHFIRYINAYPENCIAPQKAPLPENPAVLTRHIKKLAYFLGADMVGICKVPPEAMYSHKIDQTPVDINMKYAVVLLVRKDLSTVRASYGDEWIDDPVSMQCYLRLASMSTVMSDYIRRLGYPARASAFDNYVTLMPRLVCEAGLGEFSRMGIVVNPFVGANFKAAAVLTDLDLIPDKPIDFGLQHYCEQCFICADQCCTNSISRGPKVEYNGYMTWKMNEKTCAVHCTTNTHGNMCGRCAKICPFSRPDSAPEDFKDWDGNLEFIYNSVNRRRKWLEEHNFIDEPEMSDKWWFPLCEQDGKLTDAKEWDYENHFRKLEKLRKKD